MIELPVPVAWVAAGLLTWLIGKLIGEFLPRSCGRATTERDQIMSKNASNKPDEAKRDKVRKFFRETQSDRAVAKLLGVSRHLVASVRQEMFPECGRAGSVVRTGYVRGKSGQSVRVV